MQSGAPLNGLLISLRESEAIDQFCLTCERNSNCLSEEERQFTSSCNIHE